MRFKISSAVIFIFIFFTSSKIFADLYIVQGKDDDGNSVNGEISTNIYIGDTQGFIFKSKGKDVFLWESILQAV
jgi:hypothetical protein